MAVRTATLPARGAVRRRSRAGTILRRMRKQWSAYLFLFPCFLLFGVFTLASVGYAFYLSFHEWNVLEPQKPFVGLDNYRRLLDDNRFHDSIFNTVYYTAGLVPLTTGLGLLIALLLNAQIRAKGIFRTFFYLPVITPLVIASIIWKGVYQGDHGLLNYYLVQLPFIDDPPLWLSDKRLAMPAVIITNVWKSVGFAMVVYLAGLQAIPQDFYDAAKVDGASGFRRLKDITIPLLSTSTFFIIIILVIQGLQAFTQIFVMTNGGPVGQTTTVIFYIYQYAFNRFEMGYASAMAFALFVLMFGFALIQMRFFYREHDY